MKEPVEDEEPVQVLMRGASIVLDEGELVPGCTLSPSQARELAAHLIACAEELDGSCPD